MLSHDAAVIPSTVTRLFWDVDPESVDLERHKDYVIERVMSRGGWDAMGWLRTTYPAPVLRDFIQRKSKLLAPRDLAYWALVLDMEIEAPSGAGMPRWAMP